MTACFFFESEGVARMQNMVCVGPEFELPKGLDGVSPLKTWKFVIPFWLNRENGSNVFV